MEKRLLNINELSEYTRLEKSILYSWVCQRRIPFVKVGFLLKFDKKDIDKWIEKQKVQEGVWL